MFFKSTIIVSLCLSLSLSAKDTKNYNQSNNTKQSVVDLYDFVYNSKNKECILTKNTHEIDQFDSRFGDMKKPKRGKYKCSAWIKEPYSRCNIIKNRSTSAVALGFGRFNNTHLLIGFRNDSDKVDAQIVVECSK